MDRRGEACGLMKRPTMRVSVCAFLSLLLLSVFIPSVVSADDLRASVQTGTLVINELMANNESAVSDPQGDYDDWIELRNFGTAAVDAAGCYLCDDPEQPAIFARSESTITTFTLVPEGAAKRAIVPVSADHIAEDWKTRPDFEAAILRFRYADVWRPATDGGGESLEIEDPTAAAVTWNDSESWRAAEPTPGRP